MTTHQDFELDIERTETIRELLSVLKEIVALEEDENSAVDLPPDIYAAAKAAINRAD